MVKLVLPQLDKVVCAPKSVIMGHACSSKREGVLFYFVYQAQVIGMATNRSQLSFVAVCEASGEWSLTAKYAT